ncbi:NAD(P)/FAD-dependent oxidoreductase [Caulobacter sp. LjRoot300]|uniref:NAD(P)/FAD-dependent oxidoreductase n=1 Tax=Caulobacter sp. LjRoot300 TaxID=3342321 RepID=UPI003F50451F
MEVPLDSIDCVVVGAGVIGLACARALARSGLEVVVIEAASLIGSETSSRNSEVIHAGIYYPRRSLKAELCVDGRRRLYDYCDARRVPYRRCGKLIVATSQAELAVLDRLEASARANEVEGMSRLSAAQAQALEPALSCTGALLSAETGILDSHAYMLSLRGELEDAGGMIAFNSRVTGGAVTAEGIVLHVESGGERHDVLARNLVTSTGLGQEVLLRAIDGFPEDRAPRLHFAKGSYFAYRGRAPFSRLIYPAPEAGGLGVHVTLDMSGAMRFGPDVEWVDTIEYAVDVRRADGFYAAVRRYWPGLPDGAILPAYAGVRAKLAGPAEPAADFVIQGPAEHGVNGLVNLLGMESPGLTGSLSIAERVRQILKETRA